MANREQESDPENSERLAAPLRQLAWEEYAEKTPNLHRKGLRRVEQHVGFDAAWDLLQPLLTDAESRAASATTEVARLQAELDSLRPESTADPAPESAPEAAATETAAPEVPEPTAKKIKDNGEELARRLGEVYSLEDAAKHLRISTEEALERHRRGELFAVSLRDGSNLFFPLFQFKDGKPKARLLEVVRALGPGADCWTVVLWLTTPFAKAGDRTMLELIDSDRWRLILAEAKETGARWNQ